MSFLKKDAPPEMVAAVQSIDELRQFLRQHLFDDIAKAIADLLPPDMQFAVARKVNDFQGEGNLGVRLAGRSGDETGMLRIALREREPVCSQPLVDRFYYRLPHARLLQVKCSHRNEQLYPETRDEQCIVLLDGRKHPQHLGLVRNVADERLDEGVLDRKRLAVRPLGKPIDPAVFNLVRKRQRYIFPRTLLVGGDEEPDNVVLSTGCRWLEGSGLAVFYRTGLR